MEVEATFEHVKRLVSVGTSGSSYLDSPKSGEKELWLPRHVAALLQMIEEVVEISHLVECDLLILDKRVKVCVVQSVVGRTEGFDAGGTLAHCQQPN